MQDSLVTMYQSLHNLLGVCSTWRNIALARGLFWSIIPIMEYPGSDFMVRNPGKPLSTSLSLERSGNADLHLATIASERDRDLDFTQYASRFRSINILSGSIYTIGELLSNFVKSGSDLQVSSLFLCHKINLPSSQIPPLRTSLSSLRSFKYINFEDLLELISVLRLSNVMFDWDRVQFSHQLVELELQNLTLGYDSELTKLLTSLSTATGLRTLKFISVVTYPIDTLPYITTKSSISLPSLQTMVARDLFFNTLDSLLSSITSRSHRLTLHLTKRTCEIIPAEDSVPEGAAAHRIVDLFRQVNVNTLLLEAFQHEGSWFSTISIRGLLHAMPDIETLRMHDWDYPTEFCEMIQRPNIPGGFEFPSFKNIHITQARIRDEEAFKNMVASYFKSLDRMELAGTILEEWEDWKIGGDLEGEEPIVAWFEENVPDFQLKNPIIPPEFCIPVWQLW
ncbi:hypothetical protein V565_094160 [Rhizoctonia solani 123E]|uniref:F-box-like domain protein n=1 Tax=Rhizoctonia solani 123E TaxID=1423351 RepID=A0A074RSC0_9AGAM|nr:hypothetical protein V565_094160 [Rhizoctonia solani 123E]